MRYDRNDYATNPNRGANRNDAASRGWGPGWPNDNSGKMAVASGGGVRLSVRRELVPLVEALLDLTVEYGYKLKDVRDDWGFANRPIRGTRSPSNHSWGLAVDINSTDNPMQSKFVSEVPPKVVAAWEECGFYWGGRYENRPDTMHFEYIGRPRDVQAHTLAAQEMLRQAEGKKPAKDTTPNPPDQAKVPKPGPKPEVHGPNPPDSSVIPGPGEPPVTHKPRPGDDPPDSSVRPRPGKPGDRLVLEGSEGSDVAFLQRFIGYDLDDDGIFGPKTTAAVKKYQRMQKLKADGIVGEKTWGVILSKEVDL